MTPPHRPPSAYSLLMSTKQSWGGGNNRVDGKFLEMVVGIKNKRGWKMVGMENKKHRLLE